MNSTNNLMRWRLVFVVAIAIVAGTLAGCIAETGPEQTAGGSGNTSGNTSGCASVTFSGFSGTRTTNANWDYIQSTILAGRGHCTSCHTGGGAGPSNLSWDSNQYAVDVTNKLMSGYPGNNLAIIQPGYKECSFMYHKITESDSVLVAAGLGSRMPLQFSPLSSADINLIGAWIDEGAVKSQSP